MSLTVALTVSPVWDGDVAMLEGIVDSFVTHHTGHEGTFSLWLLEFAPKSPLPSKVVDFFHDLEGVRYKHHVHMTLPSLVSDNVLIIVFDPDQENPSDFWDVAFEAVKDNNVTTIFYKGSDPLFPIPDNYMEILKGKVK